MARILPVLATIDLLPSRMTVLLSLYSGVQVVDMTNQKPKVQQWTPPVPDDPRWVKPLPPEEQPDWKDEPAFVHKDDVRLFEGMSI